MHPTVSVIIPVYNVQDYLEQCLDSVIKQTYRELEIIMVNDGSTDMSGSLAKKIADSDTRCVLINQKNGGLSNARNSGLDRGTGKYVYFLDSDDWLEPNALETLVSTAEGHDCDLVVHNVNVVDATTMTVEKKRMLLQAEYGLLPDMDALKKDLLVSPCWVWNKLYRRDFLERNGLQFIDGLNYEDVPFTTALYLANPKTFYISDYLINYRKARVGSISNAVSLKSLDLFKVGKIVANLLDKHHLLQNHWLRTNLKNWEKWNYSWSYTHIPNNVRPLVLLNIYYSHRAVCSEVLSMLGMRMNIIKVLGIPLLFVKFHFEKTTYLLFGLIPIWLSRRAIDFK